MEYQQRDMKPGEVAELVRMSIKKEGTFDVVRKRALAEVENADGFLDELRMDGKVFCDGLFNQVFGDSIDIDMEKSLKEALMNRVREHATRNEVSEKIRKTIEKQITFAWVQKALEEKVEEKVRATLGLPPLPREEAEAVDPKNDAVVKQEEPDVLTVNK